MSAPIDLDTMKDDLGIPAGDSTNDAWLQRRMDGVWARFEQYTARPLQLAGPWVDDWGKLITNHPAATEPPLWRSQPSATVFLRVFPVQSIASVTLNTTTVDPTRLIVDGGSGKLIGLDTAGDLRTALISGKALIEYIAGFDTLPADLYEALRGVLEPLWAQRQAQAAGGMGGTATRIATTDVGEIEFSQSPNVFVDATMKGVRVSDPLLGPYGMILDSYVDWRSMIGGAYPVTVRGSAPVPPISDGASVGETPPLDPPDDALWWNSSAGPGGGQLYVYFNDGTSRQWVPATADLT